jgi:hypothetical protein
MQVASKGSGRREGYDERLRRPVRRAEDPVDLSRRLDGAHDGTVLSSSWLLSAQDLTALAPACGENRAATTSGHASAEAVRLGALPYIRLVRSLHCFLLVLPPR